MASNHTSRRCSSSATLPCSVRADVSAATVRCMASSRSLASFSAYCCTCGATRDCHSIQGLRQVSGKR